ncbi:MAG TPA: glycosyltransferase family 39 protein [Bryobacteraceae bacterium]|jgi:4-amino-4-deoxy-L-arabinose transferase-like glycosyltransferase|nr:glycosyltransferase family 39 protein [Bryobacteraceae bacterium]
MQNDEALFASPWFQPKWEEYGLQVGHTRLPLMLMNYLGTVKSWIYRPLFHWFGTGESVTRIPVLLAGVASVWLFYLLLRRVAGERAATIGCSLLAADASYLLTTCFDWGPVALQHLLLVGGLLLLVLFWQDGNERVLAAGFFLLGLAVWDKALAVWSLSGFAVAALVTVPRQIRKVWTMRRAALAAAGFFVGSLPLIVYNLDTRLGTLHGTVAYDASALTKKVYIMGVTFDGSGLFGWVTADAPPQPHTPQGWLETASVRLATLAGNPENSLLLYAFAAALLLAPLARGADLRAIGFALIAMAVAWGQMLFTATTGTSLHHTILLWPLPQMVIGVSFAAASRRLRRAGTTLLAVTMVVVVGSGLVVINQYYATMVRNGGAQNWSDAIDRLSDYMKGVKASTVWCVDWGILDSLRLLNRGRLPLRVTDVSSAQPSPQALREIDAAIALPSSVFLAHTPRMEFLAGVEARLERMAATDGYRREVLTVISDSYGRPSLEVYRFVVKER